MPSAKAPARDLRWLWIPARVLLVAFLLALISFAVSLLLGIVGLLISTRVRGVYPNMTVAYRHIAFPAAVALGAVAMMAAIAMEIRHYRQKRAHTHGGAGVTPVRTPR